MRQSTLPILLGALLAVVSMQLVTATDDVENCWCGTSLAGAVPMSFTLVVDPNDDNSSKCIIPLSNDEHFNRAGSDAYCMGQKTSGGNWQRLCCDKCRE